MRSKVYFIETGDNDSMAERLSKFERLIDRSGLLGCIAAGDRAAIKLHFGEKNNTGFVKPEFLKLLASRVSAAGGVPFLSDTNTLYRGQRTNSADHLKLAAEHGFTFDSVGADIVIPDDTQKQNVQDVELNGQYVKTAHIARVFWDADVLIGVAHFKGHIMTGFGGTMKNLGMGCATREGKMFQHSDVAPFVISRKCTGCGGCAGVCPVNAISLNNSVAFIDNSKCIGCASCIAACGSNAVEINWEAGGKLLQEKMVEYAKAVLVNKAGKMVFFNFLVKITQECDCMSRDYPRITDDIGILASTDPLAIDRAGYDLVKQRSGEDVFRKVHPKRDGNKQLLYAEKLRLGNRFYELLPV
jgi:hypothetical protein